MDAAMRQFLQIVQDELSLGKKGISVLPGDGDCLVVSFEDGLPTEVAGKTFVLCASPALVS